MNVGYSRIAWIASVAVGLASMVPLACSGFPFPPGYVAGPVLGVPSTCEGDAYLALPSSDCPASSCPGPVAFAVCDGTSFSGCTCQQPLGVLIPRLDAPFGDERGFSGGDGGFGSDGGGGGDGGFFFEGGEAGFADSAFFDVGDQGSCSGEVAKKIPASECPACNGPNAFLLCDGLFFTECSCVLPPGYELIDGGSTRRDAGTKDASGEHDALPADVSIDAPSPPVDASGAS